MELVAEVEVAKVHKYRQINEYMNIFSNRGQGHSLTLTSVPHILTFSICQVCSNDDFLPFYPGERFGSS